MKINFKFLIFSLILLSACAYSEEFNEINHNNEFLIAYPDYMEATDDLLSTAKLQYKNAYRNTYSIVTVEDKNNRNFEDYQRAALNIIKNDVLISKPLVTDSIYRNADNFNAIDIQLYGVMKEENIYYWHSVFETESKFYTVVCWTRSMDRQQRYGPDFIKTIESFKPLN